MAIITPTSWQAYRGTAVTGDDLTSAGAICAAVDAAIRREIAPFGMAGGEPGAKARNWVERRDGTIVPMSGTDKCQVEAGDVFVIETPGGGGYGIPEEKAA